MVSDVNPFLATGKIDFQDVDVCTDEINIGSCLQEDTVCTP